MIYSVGHGLASVAISAHWPARRNLRDLPDIAAQINTAIAGQSPASQFATAVVPRLDLSKGW